MNHDTGVGSVPSSITDAVSASLLPPSTNVPAVGERMATCGGMSLRTVTSTPARCSLPAASTACTWKCSVWLSIDSGATQANENDAVPASPPWSALPVSRVVATDVPSTSSATSTPSARVSSPTRPWIAIGTPTVASPFGPGLWMTTIGGLSRAIGTSSASPSTEAP